MIEKEALSKLNKEQLVGCILKQAGLVGFYTSESSTEELEENAFKEKIEHWRTSHGGKEELIETVVLLSDKIKSRIENNKGTRDLVSRLLDEVGRKISNIEEVTGKIERLKIEKPVSKTNGDEARTSSEEGEENEDQLSGDERSAQDQKAALELNAKNLTERLIRKFVEESESELKVSRKRNIMEENKVFTNVNKTKFEKTLPKFSGNASENFDDWLFESCQQYNNLQDNEMMGVVLPLLRGQALQILKRMKLFDAEVDWQKFKNELINSYITDTKERKLRKDLKDLRQKASFNDYLAKFRELANQLIGIPEQELMNAFIDGLKPKARYECIMRKTESLQEAMRVARIFEECHEANNKVNNKNEEMYVLLGS